MGSYCVTGDSISKGKMGDHILLDLEEWALVLSKMLRFHFNVSEDIKKIVQTIRVEMKPELIPLAEEKSNFGKVLKKAIREMWALEYELEDVKKLYADQIKDLEVMKVTRPAKPVAAEKPAEPAAAPAPEAAKA